MIKLPKGTQDYINDDYLKLNNMKKMLTNIFETFQGQPLITPTFECRDVLTNKYGEEEKLIFNIENYKEDGELISLRYDMTIPLVRHVLCNGIKKMKRYSIGKVYRRENCNKKNKRLREFHQADFDFVGEFDEFLPEIQIFKMINIFFSKLGIKNYEIRYNFRQLLYYYIVDIAGVSEDNFKNICSSLDKLDKKDRDFIKNEMVSKGLNENQVDTIFSCIDNNYDTDDDFNDYHKKLLDLVDIYNITNIKFDSSLARGLDYYTGIIFEIVIDGYNYSVGGGGRYDNLINKYNSKVNLPMIGFSFGLDRLLQFSFLPSRYVKPTISVLSLTKNVPEEECKILEKAKSNIVDIVLNCNYGVDFRFNERNICKEISKISKNENNEFIIIIGMDELKNNKVTIKYLKTGVQLDMSIDNLENFLKSELKTFV